MNWLKVAFIWIAVFWSIVAAIIIAGVTGQWGLALFFGLCALGSVGIMLGVFKRDTDK